MKDTCKQIAGKQLFSFWAKTSGQKVTQGTGQSANEIISLNIPPIIAHQTLLF
ncbi:MAG: hypothetical protein JRI52_08490 [Deltaproteobacteria bacterium]|nr:hypothetical protein [Deltaproteobacteria bacterium]